VVVVDPKSQGEETVGSLEGKVAFVTGAARGLGRAIAVRAAKEGCDIIALDICRQVETADSYPGSTDDDLAETVSLVEQAGRKALPVIADVRDLSAMKKAAGDGVDSFGRLDIVVAAAGILSGSGRIWEFSQEQWQTTLDVNLTGVWHTFKSTVPILVRQDEGGVIVVINSVCGLKGMPFLGPYNAAKHGVVGITGTLANEVGEYGIRVNSIHPSGMDTAMGNSDAEANLVRQHAMPLGPLYQSRLLPSALINPEHVASLAIWLASDDAAHMTGAHLPIDLGLLNR
jgi:SDR family mycofactocin-dependent oxidoreductase